jgi:hypothetical protein
MSTTPADSGHLEGRAAVITWLLDGDPAIRWQVLRDLAGEPDEVVARERSRVAVVGWGARLLELQAADGHWGGASFVPRAWVSTFDTLQLLKELGLDPAGERAQSAITRVRERCTWGPEWGHSPFFEGEVEPCINGRVLALGAYFGAASDRLLERLLQEQLPDGGWNCRAPESQRSSFHTTICVLDGLLEYERVAGASPALSEARQRAQEYLLERQLFRSRSTGAVIREDWLEFSFPPRWHYDVLRGLDYLRRAGVGHEPRLAEALEMVARRRDASGRWPLENPHPGKPHFELEGGAGEPSRWNTLRALRVLDWFEGAGAQPPQLAAPGRRPSVT